MDEYSMEMKIVEVFKTNIKSLDTSQFIIEKLKDLLPDAKINFDLEDCDCILRVETVCSEIDVNEIMHFIRELNFEIEVLI